MATPHYTAVKVGDRYELVRSDKPGKVNNGMYTTVGAAIAMMGLHSRGLTRLVMMAFGGGLAYRGVTGRSALKALGFGCASCGKSGSSHQTPSYQHDYKGKSGQLPEDSVDEQSMESFPASDAPAHSVASVSA